MSDVATPEPEVGLFVGGPLHGQRRAGTARLAVEQSDADGRRWVYRRDRMVTTWAEVGTEHRAVVTVYVADEHTASTSMVLSALLVRLVQEGHSLVRHDTFPSWRQALDG